MKALIILALALTPIAAEAKGKKPKPAPVVVQSSVAGDKAQSDAAPKLATPQPGEVPATSAPAQSFMDRQIAAALANQRPVGVTTYGAAAALQSGGVEAAEQASGGW